jgi:serine/threonine protein kinase/Tol biopolymer transport system component
LIGKKVSHYNILQKLGEGGMGVVYKAKDTKLGREIALKALPEEFAQNRERLARFEREAKLLASLNHPNIATIYGLEESEGLNFLTLELVEGETLAGKLTSGPLKVQEALEICRQIAEGLESAHQKGIIHRDLKPSNIKVTPEGKVKVLDFGLAKAFQVAEVGDDAGMDPYKSPTLTVESSRSGVIMGTAAYMSPEQARGKPLDKRTDIWSFGCVFYEILTGQQLFKRETTSDMVAGILKQEPDWTALPRDLPVRIQELLRRCLNKDPNKRLHDIADARIDLEEALAKPLSLREESFETRGEMRPNLRHRIIPWMIVALVAIIALFAFWQWIRVTRSITRPVTRFVLPLQSGQPLVGQGPRVAISPDGSNLIYVSWGAGNPRLYVRKMDQLDANPIPGTEGADTPFFSSDGQWVGFIAGDKLKKVSFKGGLPITIAKDLSNVRGASWGSNNIIIFSRTNRSGLYKVSAAGGPPQQVTTLDEEQGEVSHRWPEILPGNNAALFSILRASLDDMQIGVVSIETGEVKILIDPGCQPRYISTGHIIYTVPDGSLLAVPFNPSRLEVTGPAIPLKEGITVRDGGASDFMLSMNGSLVYAGEVSSERALVLVDRQGRERILTDKRHDYFSPSFSPDGKKIAVTISLTGKRDVWIYDIEQDTLTRLTFEGSHYYPVWTPDGKRVAFSSSMAGTYDLYWKLADFSGTAEPLLVKEGEQLEISFTPEGKLLVFRERHPVTSRDIWILPLDGERTPQPFLNTSFNERSPMLSPDGRWLAYVSDDSGRSEIYVRTFSDLSGSRWQVSTDGGTEPLWAKNGKELFYRGSNRFFSASIETEPTFKVGTREALFEDVYWNSAVHTLYDIHPDGKRFVMVKGLQQRSELIVVQNWFEELRHAFQAEKK